ncbi:MAG: hypothetical protein QRY74_05360 [Chlamydia sp.]
MGMYNNNITTIGSNNYNSGSITNNPGFISNIVNANIKIGSETDQPIQDLKKIVENVTNKVIKEIRDPTSPPSSVQCTITSTPPALPVFQTPSHLLYLSRTSALPVPPFSFPGRSFLGSAFISSYIIESGIESVVKKWTIQTLCNTGHVNLAWFFDNGCSIETMKEQVPITRAPYAWDHVYFRTRLYELFGKEYVDKQYVLCEGTADLPSSGSPYDLNEPCKHDLSDIDVVYYIRENGMDAALRQWSIKDMCETSGNVSLKWFVDNGCPLEEIKKIPITGSRFCLDKYYPRRTLELMFGKEFVDSAYALSEILMRDILEESCVF